MSPRPSFVMGGGDLTCCLFGAIDYGHGFTGKQDPHAKASTAMNGLKDRLLPLLEAL